MSPPNEIEPILANFSFDMESLGNFDFELDIELGFGLSNSIPDDGNTLLEDSTTQYNFCGNSDAAIAFNSTTEQNRQSIQQRNSKNQSRIQQQHKNYHQKHLQQKRISQQNEHHQQCQARLEDEAQEDNSQKSHINPSDDTHTPFHLLREILALHDPPTFSTFFDSASFPPTDPTPSYRRLTHHLTRFRETEMHTSFHPITPADAFPVFTTLLENSRSILHHINFDYLSPSSTLTITPKSRASGGSCVIKELVTFLKRSLEIKVGLVAPGWRGHVWENTPIVGFQGIWQGSVVTPELGILCFDDEGEGKIGGWYSLVVNIVLEGRSGLTLNDTISNLASAWLSGSSGACSTAVFITTDPKNPPVWDDDELNGLVGVRGSRVEGQAWDAEVLMSMDIGALWLQVWSTDASGRPFCRTKQKLPQYTYDTAYNAVVMSQFFAPVTAQDVYGPNRNIPTPGADHYYITSTPSTSSSAPSVRSMPSSSAASSKSGGSSIASSGIRTAFARNTRCNDWVNRNNQERILRGDQTGFFGLSSALRPLRPPSNGQHPPPQLAILPPASDTPSTPSYPAPPVFLPSPTNLKTPSLVHPYRPAFPPLNPPSLRRRRTVLTPVHPAKHLRDKFRDQVKREYGFGGFEVGTGDWKLPVFKEVEERWGDIPERMEGGDMEVKRGGRGWKEEAESEVREGDEGNRMSSIGWNVRGRKEFGGGKAQGQGICL